MYLNKCVYKPVQNLKRRHNVYPGLLRQNRMFRLSENTELSMEEIHYHVFQFIDGTRNL